jgi:ribose transport system permease protein
MRTKKNALLTLLVANGVFIPLGLLIIIFCVYAIAGNNVLSVFALSNLLNNTVALAVASIGLTLVIVVGGFDLSAGAVVTLANCIAAMHGGKSLGDTLVIFLLVSAAGIIVGVINGFFIAFLNVQSMATTLAMMIMCQGVTLIIMPLPGGSVPPYITGLTKAVGGVVPISLVVIVIGAVCWVLLRKTSFGVQIFAIGEDERAAAQSGISTKMVKFWTYVLAGFIYSLAGIMLSAQTASGDPNGSTLFLLLVFASVAIGGAKFGGGRGTAVGSILGAGILTVLQKALFAVGVATFYTSIFQGVVLIAAVLIGGLTNKLSAKWR